MHPIIWHRTRIIFKCMGLDNRPEAMLYCSCLVTGVVLSNESLKNSVYPTLNTWLIAFSSWCWKMSLGQLQRRLEWVHLSMKKARWAGLMDRLVWLLLGFSQMHFHLLSSFRYALFLELQNSGSRRLSWKFHVAVGIALDGENDMLIPKSLAAWRLEEELIAT